MRTLDQLASASQAIRISLGLGLINGVRLAVLEARARGKTTFTAADIEAIVRRESDAVVDSLEEGGDFRRAFMERLTPRVLLAAPALAVFLSDGGDVADSLRRLGFRIRTR